MPKKTHYLVLLFVTHAFLLLFSNCNLIGQEQKAQQTNWESILEQLNDLEDIHESAKIKHLKILSDLLQNIQKPPTKDEISSIKSNRLKLTLANLFTENKKYLWAEEIFRQIEVRKLDNKDCRLLFELETVFLLQYPNRDSSVTLLETLKVLVKNCHTELAEKPGHLNELFQFYVSKQLLSEALDLAEILWKDDAYHYHCGILHQRAHRLRWDAKNNFHFNLAKEHFEAIGKKYPNSPFLLSAEVNLIILNFKEENTSETVISIREKLLPNIEKIPLDNIRDLLDTIAIKATEPEIILLLKEWYQLLLSKNATMSTGELVLTFMFEKCQLSLEEISQILNKEKHLQKAIPDTLKNASIQKKIQYLVFWKSAWVPLADFRNPLTSFRYDQEKGTSYLITKNTQKEQLNLKYDVPAIENLPDYIYCEIRSLEAQSVITILFNFDGTIITIDKIVCSLDKKLVRIPINAEMKASKKWQIIINHEAKVDVPLIEISAPIFLTIKKIADLDKKIKE